MTRINTNVSSLIARNTLTRNNADLQTALTRLSTGLRINVGKDDPAGLIASEALRSDITSIEKAISNSERANQVIATADSALGQVSKLLNDIRGLVVEAANSGALSDDQIAANQLQVDSSLEAINRIAQTTTFQGRRLLDGSLDFVSTVGAVTTVRDAQIDQANLGALGTLSVDVDIATAATQAEITNSAGFTAAANATATLEFRAGAAITFASGGRIDINAVSLGDAEDNVAISFVDGGGASPTTAVYTASTSLVVTYDFTGGTTVGDVINAINTATGNNSNLIATLSAGATTDAVVAADGALTGTTDQDSLTITADTAGADFNNVQVRVQSGAANAANYDSVQRILTVTINNAAPQDLSAINTVVDNLADFSSVANANGTTRVDVTTQDGQATASTDNTGGGVLLDTLVVSIGGTSGREVFNFEAGASINQIAAAINLVSDAVGVQATQASNTLTLQSTGYGSKALVDVDVIDEGVTGTFEANLSAARATGTDISATINGVAATGDGNTFQINTATLDLKLTVDDGSSTNFNFDITSGGALFQLGPDVVSNQQARIGITSLSTSKLGGAAGKLFELATGGAKALAVDSRGAANVVNQVINKVTTLRGRLGAFQRTTLDTNIASLNDTLSNLTEAESSIRDADFAVESSRLTRAQILVQSGTSVLAIANSNPQNVLALLR